MSRNLFVKLSVLVAFVLGCILSIMADAPYQYEVVDKNGVKMEIYDGGVCQGVKKANFRYMIIKDDSHNDLESAVIPDSFKDYFETSAEKSLKSLYKYDCEITGVVDVIGHEAFRGSKIKEITLPSSLKRIESRAFFGSDVRDIVVPPGVEYIGQEAFAYSHLRSIKINDGPEELGWGCFERVFYIEKIDLPSTLKKLGGRTFHHSYSFADVICRAVVPPVADNSDFGLLQEYFEYMDSYGPNNCIRAIYVPAESVEAYKNAPGWCTQSSLIHSLDEYEETQGVVEVAEEESFPYTITGNDVHISCRAGDSLSICDVNGVVMESRRFAAPEVYTYSGDGICILTLNGKSIKVVL